VGEVIRISTSTLAARSAVTEVLGRGMWRCNISEEKHVRIGFVKPPVKIIPPPVRQRFELLKACYGKAFNVSAVPSM
jgi:hypothetical protein